MGSPKDGNNNVEDFSSYMKIFIVYLKWSSLALYRCIPLESSTDIRKLYLGPARSAPIRRTTTNIDFETGIPYESPIKAPWEPLGFGTLPYPVYSKGWGNDCLLGDPCIGGRGRPLHLVTEEQRFNTLSGDSLQRKRPAWGRKSIRAT